ncbi:MAG: helix-hairpin-helix domain-containing protein [Blautia sp.]|nr:helix-hairpin-helix domain-containing protein [Blautia sp.]
MNHKKSWNLKKATAGIFTLLLCVFLCGCTDRTAAFLEETSGEEAMEETHGDTEETDTQENESGITPTAAVTIPPEEIYVDVCGAVNHPGVYSLDPGSRVFQAIEAAGGCTDQAAGEYVNQAERLSDGQQVYVPTRQEAEEQKLSHSAAAAIQGEHVSDMAGKVNLNTADETELTTLTGIGAARAQAIILYREENGPFSSIEEIMNVQGIKEGTFEKIKDDIVVG